MCKFTDTSEQAPLRPSGAQEHDPPATYDHTHISTADKLQVNVQNITRSKTLCVREESDATALYLFAGQSSALAGVSEETVAYACAAVKVDAVTSSSSTSVRERTTYSSGVRRLLTRSSGHMERSLMCRR
jgi:hypothetical protein